MTVVIGIDPHKASHEGARGLGQLLVQQLVIAGEHVVDVPSTLSPRVRAPRRDTAARPTAPTPAPSQSSPPDAPIWPESPQMTTTRCSACCRTAAANSPANGAGPSTGCTATCATCSQAECQPTSAPTLRRPPLQGPPPRRSRSRAQTDGQRTPR